MGHGEYFRTLLRSIISKPNILVLFAGAAVVVALLIPSSVERRQVPPDLLIRPMPTQRFSLLVVGDSLSISLGEQVENYFSRYADWIEVQRLGKVSSGLARPDFFDWEQNLEDLVRIWNPGVVVIMIGTNDNKPLRRDHHTYPFGTESWRREYKRRLQHLYDICRRRNRAVRILWVGAPIMRDPLLAQELTLINQTIESWCRTTAACEYVSTWSVLADKDGNFMESFEDEETGRSVAIRTRDGVHLTPHGSFLLAKAAIDAIRKYCPLERQQETVRNADVKRGVFHGSK
jgi:hypothetical protein